MKPILFLLCLLGVSLAQPFPIPEGQPRQSGAGVVTTDCTKLRLGEEPPFPIGYLDQVNNYLYPNLRKLQSQRDLAGSYRRTFHFPTVGCANATFTVRADLPEALRVGLFATPGMVYPTYLRFSGQDKETQNDTRGDAKGLAIKFSNVPGNKLMPGFEDDHHMDIVMNAFPVFVPQNETGFSAAVFARTVLCGGGAACVSRFGQTFAPNAAVGATELANNTVSSVLTMPFYAISPYQYGSGPLPPTGRPAVKYRIFPCNYTASIGLPLPANTPADYLTTDFISRLAAEPYCFDLQIQLQTDPCMHPINDFFVEWKEEDTPYITVGRINIPVQAATDVSDSTCRNVAFNAWRVLDEHRPLGSLNRARLFDMMNSHNQRLSLNNVIEPTSPRNYPGVQYLAPEEIGINENFRPFRMKTDGFPANNV